MVVASPMPSMPSLQRRRTITSVWRCITAMASWWARMVGRSTRIASTEFIVTGFILSKAGSSGQAQYRLRYTAKSKTIWVSIYTYRV